MELSVENLQKRVALNPLQARKIARAVLHHEGIVTATLSIVFVTRQRIQALNQKFLRRRHSTDVLAFDADDRRKADHIAGDIIISTDAALNNSRLYGTTLSKELALYVIHGIIHLLGYDDHRKRDIEEMRKKEQELLTYLGAKAEKITVK
jgi:probable rRNA maturation factor